MNIRDQILSFIETLEAFYFLLNSLEPHQERLGMIRAECSTISKTNQLLLHRELLMEIEYIRAQSGAIAPDCDYCDLLVSARKTLGRAYLSKLVIDSKLFSHYETVFPRWPHVKHHALVVFDGSAMKDLQSILEVEGMLFRDVKLLLSRSKESHKNIEDFRKRMPDDQERLQSYLRSAISAIFHFMEAYLNGLAYDCFHLHHDKLTLDDHDMLGEWNSDKMRTRFVAFNKKLFRYPVIVAKMEGIHVDLSRCKSAHVLATDGKNARDALTHPSHYIDPNTGFQEKLLFVTGVSLTLVEYIFEAAKQYVTFVEESLRRDPKQTTPWLFE